MDSPSRVPEQQAVLMARGVCRTLGQTEILKEISLEIAPGELLSITGPSGSGKTTLLYLMGALDQPDHGEIWIKQQLVSKLKDKERSRLRQQALGFVFQFHFLLPELSALENVAVSAMLAGVPRSNAEKLAATWLEQVGLAHRLGHRPGQLSGGEQQRVAIARALINQPQLILADEPTGNLDSENSELVFALLQRLNREHGIAIALVTHSQELANQTGRQICIRDGRIEAVHLRV